MTITRKTAGLVPIYVLNSPVDAVTRVSAGRIIAPDAAIELIGSNSQMGFDEPAGLRETLDLLADLGASVPVPLAVIQRDVGGPDRAALLAGEGGPG